MNNMHTRSWSQWAGDDFLTRTSDFNMVPGNIFVTASLNMVVGESVQAAGIARAASVQAGEENFGNYYWQWRSAIYRQGLRTLTVAVSTSPRCAARALFTLHIF
ncbi:hypothetical protein [Rhodoligotrophos defluvii]|uniref:hypothetical protein n=1 Tax=Rhodoligotrophos defluvii TaxID=2561934 RepID=UPI0010C9E945|nr:hypothetical protein [Rhodoligotrophos defluvii]